MPVLAPAETRDDHTPVYYGRLVDMLCRWYVIVPIGGLLGALFFTHLYGVSVLNPLNDRWLFNNSDLEQHYTGWVFYRESPWRFPLGMISDLAYPDGIPITYLDALPIAAITFKALDPVLPHPFQYFGLWGLLCFTLQGALGAVIARRFTRSPMLVLISSLLFVITPVFIARTFVHSALSANWLILAAIAALLYRRMLNSFGLRWEVVAWSGLMSLTVLVHPYYVPMVGTCLAAYVILSHTSLGGSAMRTVVPGAVMFAAFWVIGGFALQGESSAAGLDIHGYNLFSPVNPVGWSDIVSSRPVDSNESMNYLGLGILLLCFLAGSHLLLDASYRHTVFSRARANKRLIWVSLCFAVLLVMAMGTVIRYQSVVLVDLRSLSPRILDLWGTFRASGRLFWPIYYLIITGALATVLTKFRDEKVRGAGVALLVVILAVQYVDVVRSPRGAAAQTVPACCPRTPEEQMILEKVPSLLAEGDVRKTHLVYLDPPLWEFFDLNELAMRNRLTMNTGYFARMPAPDKLAREQAKAISDITHASQLDANTVYVTKNLTLAETGVESGRYTTVQAGQYLFISEK